LLGSPPTCDHLNVFWMYSLSSVSTS
jgi:hypothetical protein